MLIRLTVILALLTMATRVDGAPVLTTQDNYTTPVLPIVEDFDDGVANTPGLIPYDHKIVAGGIGGGKAMEPTTFSQLLDGSSNTTGLGFEFEAPWPTQVGFVTTQADIEGNVFMLTLPVNLTANLAAPFAPNRYLQITDPDGIQAFSIAMWSPVPGEPFFQIDDVQFVPEPSGAILSVIGTAVLLILGWRR